jgi:hypothetical protein
VTVFRAPLADRLVRRVELLVGTVMRRCGNWPGWSRRADDFTAAGKGSGHFDAHFQVDLTVPVNGEVPARAGYLMSAENIPHDSAGFGDNPRELLRPSAPAYHSQRTTSLFF